VTAILSNMADPVFFAAFVTHISLYIVPPTRTSFFYGLFNVALQLLQAHGPSKVSWLVVLLTTSFNIQKFCVLLTKCINGFRMSVKTNP
jgi:hypothetical protein